MSKRENRGVVVLFLIGCLLIAAGIFLDIDYYSSIMIGCGAAMSLNCLANWIRNYYHNRPENIEAYQKKKKQQDIDLKDERMIYIRYKSGYHLGGVYDNLFYSFIYNGIASGERLYHTYLLFDRYYPLLCGYDHL